MGEFEWDGTIPLVRMGHFEWEGEKPRGRLEPSTKTKKRRKIRQENALFDWGILNGTSLNPWSTGGIRLGAFCLTKCKTPPNFQKMPKRPLKLQNIVKNSLELKELQEKYRLTQEAMISIPEV